MKTPKVRLYMRVRRSDGRYSYLDPAWNRNRTLKAGYALVDGQPEYHPGAVYYLRFLRGGRRLWEAVGTEPDRALTALRNTEHDLGAITLGRIPDSLPAPVPMPSPIPAPAPEPVAGSACKAAVSLNEAIKSYLTEIRKFRSKRTIAACEHTHVQVLAVGLYLQRSLRKPPTPDRLTP